VAPRLLVVRHYLARWDQWLIPGLYHLLLLELGVIAGRFFFLPRTGIDQQSCLIFCDLDRFLL
jgi:hypothetical protein